MNGIENKIQLILQVEERGLLPFLDVGIAKMSGNLVIKIYRKPTHTQQYIHWNTINPKNNVVGSVERIYSQGPYAL